MPELPRELVADLQPGKKLNWKDLDRVMDAVAPKGSTARVSGTTPAPSTFGRKKLTPKIQCKTAGNLCSR